MLFIARATTFVVLFVGGLASMSLPALAHIDPDPEEAPAGSGQSVGFTVEHGCEGSPTIELQMRLPDGIVTATPEPPAGWTGAIEGNVVSFAGGSLAADVEETFRVRVVLPLTPGVTIYFPFVQRCEAGEIAWIDIPRDESGTELDEPAPAMLLTTALPGTVAPTTIPVPIPTTADTSLQSQLDAAAPADDEESTGSGGEVIFYAVIVVVVGAGAFVLVRARRKR